MIAVLAGSQRMGVFENRVPRRILGPKREEVTGGRGTLQNEEINTVKLS